MLHVRQIHPIARAVAVFSAVAALVTGVTFAALNSQATLTNNIISSATASLQVKSSGSFAAQDAGFAFTGLVPGGAAAPTAGHAFQLRNAGDTDLDVFVSIPTAPVFTGGPVDQTKVNLIVTCATVGGQNFTKTASLSALVAAHGTGGLQLVSGFLPQGTDNVANCTAKAQMDADAITGSSAVSSGFFNIVFTGTVHTAI